MKKVLFFLRRPLLLILRGLNLLGFFQFYFSTRKYQCKNRIDFWFLQKVFGINNAYWPVHPSSVVYDWKNIYAGVDTCPGIMNGCYIQGKGGIHIGDYTQIAPNVVIVSANHDVHDNRKHIPSRVEIGKYCWIGAGAKIMPGVRLGDFTIVGAGAVVTKSFPEGHCIVGGVPAKKIKDLNKGECVRYELEPRYYGYLSEGQFKKLREKYPTIY